MSVDTNAFGGRTRTGSIQLADVARRSDGGYLSSRDSRRSLRMRPPVWQCGQYVIT